MSQTKGSKPKAVKDSTPQAEKGSAAQPGTGSTPHKEKGSAAQPPKGSTSKPAKGSSSHSVDNDALQPVDENFLQQLRVGAHLFHYPRQGDAETSFKASPSAEYTMYSVIDVPTENDIVLTRSFDEAEGKKSYTWDDLLAGEWWYNPDAPHKK